MREDLKGPKVEGISIAITKEINVLGEAKYDVYLINKKDEKLEKVIITSRGYIITADEKEEKKTDTLRKLLGDLEGNSFTKIEPILEEVLALHNEYWVSFWIGDQLYDKKFIFLADSFANENIANIPYLNKKGILIGD